MKKVLISISLLPVILFVSCAAWVHRAKLDRINSEEFIRSHFNKYDYVKIIKLVDYNEEFPSCCPAFSAELDVDGNSLKLSDLNIDKIKNKKRFNIFSINGSRIECKSVHGYSVIGINAIGFSDPNYQKLNIQSIDDLLAKRQSVFEYFNKWPSSSKNGIKIESTYDGGMLSCYIARDRGCE